MTSIKLVGSLLLLFLGALLTVDAGTFTNYSTLIPVPAQADGTVTGDTMASTTNTINLDANVYIPDGATSPAPAIVVLHGFGGDKNYSKTVALAEDFAAAGYVVLTPSARGFGNSDGKVTLAGPDEINDLKTIITAMQTGVIGTVNIPVSSASKFGVTGISYGGGQTWELMRAQVTNLVAVVPIIGWTDLYQALAPNDVPKLTFVLGLFASGYNPQNPNYSTQMFDWLGDLLGGTPEKLRQGDGGTNVDWRSVIFNPAELTIPTFVIQGWRDSLFPTEQATTLLAASNNIPFFKLYVGGLGHPPASSDVTGPEGMYIRAQALRWFDQWLKGTDTGILDEPRVTIAPELTADWATNQFIEANTLPLPGMTTNTLYLNLTGLTTAGPGLLKPQKLQPTSRGFSFLSKLLHVVGVNTDSGINQVLTASELLNSGATDILDEKMFTQTDSDARRLGYNSDPLPADLRVLGNPVVQLYVSAKKADSYYFVQIEEKPATGNATLITRGAFKDHATDYKTPHLIQFSPFAMNHVFAAGSQIKLLIASRDYPFFLANLKQQTALIYRDTAHPSALLLPVAP